MDSPRVIFWFAGSNLTADAVHFADISHGLHQVLGKGSLLHNLYPPKNGNVRMKTLLSSAVSSSVSLEPAGTLAFRCPEGVGIIASYSRDGKW